MAATLITPLAVMANDDHHRGERRYYDRDGRDYHYWNGDEDLSTAHIWWSSTGRMFHL
jgi:hypothetical protein